MFQFENVDIFGSLIGCKKTSGIFRESEIIKEGNNF